MTVFMDTSVFMRKLLNQPGAFATWAKWDRAVASELLRVEAGRTLDRLRLQRGIRDLEVSQLAELMQKSVRVLEYVPLSRAVLKRASGPFPAPLGTLDAIHLASALLWMDENDEPITFLTHDIQLAIAARACGLEVQTEP